MKNMKKLSALLFALVLGTLLALSAFAALPRLVDDADLLRSAEEDIVLDKLDYLYDEYSFDVVIVTVDSTDGSYVSDYADNFYDNNGYGNDGILLLLCMDSREYWFSTTGAGQSIFSDFTLIGIEDEILDELGEGRYYKAFCEFADLCGDCLEGTSFVPTDSYVEYEPYEPSYVSQAKEPFNLGLCLIISIAIGFIIALIVVSVWKGQLKSVKYQPNASAYMKGGLALTQSNDTFLYHTVNRVPKAPPPSSSSGGGSVRASVGRSHGGRGGKF